MRLLTWIDLDDESKQILINITDNEGKPTGKQSILYLPSISTVKKLVMEQEINRLLYFHMKFELRLIMLQCLKTLLCKILSEPSNNIKFIPYGLNALTKKERMREIVIQQNLFLNEAKIVPIFGIMPPDKQQVVDILGKSLHFTGMKTTRKTVNEGKYLLVTTKNKFTAYKGKWTTC